MADTWLYGMSGVRLYLPLLTLVPTNESTWQPTCSYVCYAAEHLKILFVLQQLSVYEHPFTTRRSRCPREGGGAQMVGLARFAYRFRFGKRPLVCDITGFRPRGKRDRILGRNLGFLSGA